MKVHLIKLNEKYCDAVYNQKKLYEIRLNDRNYEVGDLVVFRPWKDNCDHIHPLASCLWEITHLTPAKEVIKKDLDEKNGQWVVFGAKKVDEDPEIVLDVLVLDLLLRGLKEDE